MASPAERSIGQLTPDQRFHLFLDAACDYAIFFMDQTGQICEWSNGAEKVLGYSEAEALRMNGHAIFTPEDRERHVPEMEMDAAVREGQANDERWHVRKDGAIIFCVGRMVSLKDPHGNLYGFAKILRDATPRKELEQALRVSDEQFRATFAQAPVGLVLSNLQGQIQQVNAAFCRLTGFQEKDVLGRELLSLTCAEDRERERQLLNELLDGRRESAVLEKRMLRADGSQVWVQNSSAILRDAEGRPLSLIDLCQDISVLKLSAQELENLVAQRTAALEDKTKQMEAFCYTVAHDLRAPLRAMAGYAECLRQDFGALLPPQGTTFVRRIEASAAELDRLISDLLGYTRAQQVPLRREEVDLTALAEQVIERVKQELPVPGLAIELNRPLGHARGDRPTLEHVFQNLISNAVKFRREDVPPRVRIYSEKTNGRLRVWVEDNGIGIDPRFKDRAFAMFERLHPDRNIPGTGVGLAIVATAMERLGGARGVEPNRPAGSRFWIEFPP